MICPKCGTENGDSSLKCVKCWRPLQPVEKGPWLDSKPKRPAEAEAPAEKLPPARARRILSILVLVGVIFSFVVPAVFEKMERSRIRELKEKERQEATRPAPMPKKNEAAPVVADSQESRVSLGVIPSLDAKVKSLRFFESGYEPAQMGERAYDRQFRRDRSRYVNWEIHLTHRAREEGRDFQIDEIWYKPDGSVLAKQKLKSHLQESWLYSYHYHSWGWDEPSHWPLGKYRVELYVDGARIAAGSFTII